MPRLVAQIHHDFAGIFEIVVLFFDLREIGPRQIKGNPNHRFSRWTSPFIRQVASRTEFRDLFLFQLAIELLHKLLCRRALQL